MMSGMLSRWLRRARAKVVIARSESLAIGEPYLHSLVQISRGAFPIPADGHRTIILFEATLSFLGLGVQPPTPSWGTMLSGGRAHLLDAPHLTLFPGMAMAVLVLGFHFLGDGLRDLTDPKKQLRSIS